MKISLLAVIPNIQSAIKMGGDGARLQFDVPESELAALVNLIAHGRNKVLKLTIETDDHTE